MAEDDIKIVPYESEDWTKDNVVFIQDVTITYGQNPDCTEDGDEVGFQEITLSTRNNGVARFINIKTDNWSISDENDLVAIVKDFSKRASLLDNTEEKKNTDGK